MGSTGRKFEILCWPKVRKVGMWGLSLRPISQTLSYLAFSVDISLAYSASRTLSCAGYWWPMLLLFIVDPLKLADTANFDPLISMRLLCIEPLTLCASQTPSFWLWGLHQIWNMAAEAALATQ